MARAWQADQAAHGPARHDVIRLIPDPSDEPGHPHVTTIETVSPTGRRTWYVDDFVRAVRAGERFKIREDRLELEVVPTACDLCARVTVSISKSRA